MSSATAAATSSLATSVLRVVLMPLDAWQTAKQVNGEHGFRRVLEEVLKTLQQTAGRDMTYTSAAKELLRQDGVRGLFGRGLPTKVASSGFQGAVFLMGYDLALKKLSF
ncbi:Integrase catalytic domain-containing protein [Durusdinium trenchii]|uniref:Integrase catalytic domain-containing protein n=1 Tax=Durusdinium trenchii TaxID=1381693 RepID=A0ABP0RLA0_9DINO